MESTVNIRTARSIALLISIGIVSAYAAERPEFEVATVKPSAPITDGRIRVMLNGGPGTPDPGRLTGENVTLRVLLTKAYGVKSYQIQGPAWMDSERYDVSAKVPVGTTKPQFEAMLQNLIADRFKMTLHREKKDLPAYALILGKGGSKLKPSAPLTPAPEGNQPQAPPQVPNPQRMQMGRDGFPTMPAGMGRGGIAMMMMPGRARLVANGGTVTRLAETLEQQLDRAVIDETGLTGNYDFTLTFEPDASRGMGIMGAMPAGMGRAMSVGGPGGGPVGDSHQPEAEPVANLFTAVQEQLGLKLEPRKSPVEQLIVDHAEKTPIEN